MGNVNMEASQINYRNNSKPSLRNVSAALTNLFNANTSIIGDINELTETVNLKADKIDIAPFFDEEDHYYIGDLVFESGRLWKFTANHAPGEWNQEEVSVTTVADEIGDVKSGFTNLDTEVNGDATTYDFADVITIEDAVPANLADCNVKIEPVQSGSGDPSPTNIRPITGHTEASVEVTDGDGTTKTYTIALGDTIYGGTVDFDSGVMTVTHKYMKVTDLTRSNNTLFYKTLSDAGVPNNYTVLCDREKTANQWGDVGVFTDQYGAFMLKTAEEYTSTADCLTAYGGELNICYPLATPTTIQLTPKQIQLLKGTNTLTASTGQISVTANGVSGSIGAVQEQVNATDAALAELAEKLPTAPTTDGTYTLTVTVADGTPTYSWVSGS